MPTTDDILRELKIEREKGKEMEVGKALLQSLAL